MPKLRLSQYSARQLAIATILEACREAMGRLGARSPRVQASRFWLFTEGANWLEEIENAPVDPHTMRDWILELERQKSTFWLTWLEHEFKSKCSNYTPQIQQEGENGQESIAASI